MNVHVFVLPEKGLLVVSSAAASFLSLVVAASASGFPCSEHNFVTVGPNQSKLGMHVSMQCQATHLLNRNKITSLFIKIN